MRKQDGENNYKIESYRAHQKVDAEGYDKGLIRSEAHDREQTDGSTLRRERSIDDLEVRVKSPVLLIVYNRPEKTKQVIQQLQKERPPKVYIVADGAVDTSDEDQEKCRQVRELIQGLDWNGALDSIVPNDTATNGTATKHTANNDTAPNDTANNDAAPNDAAPNDTANKGAAPNDAAPKHTATNGTPPNITALTENASNDQPSNVPFSDLRPIKQDEIKPVTLITQFRDKNLGCGPSVKQAIDWFFTQEEEGIILEDDTVPDPSFFRFCDELLERYRTDERIGFISGSNHFSDVPSLKPNLSVNSEETHRTEKIEKSGALESSGMMNPAPSYFFARNKTTWGWATWKRAWHNMDYEMSWLQEKGAHNIIRNMSLLEESTKYWKNALMSIREKNVSAWDWQWYFSVAAKNQLVIYPNVNLVSNIGFGQDATHTIGRAEKEVIQRHRLSFPLHHPENVISNDQWDLAFEEKKLQIRYWFIKKHLPVGLKRFIRRNLRKIRNGRVQD